MACANTRPSEIDVIDLIGKDNGVVLTQEDVQVLEPVVTTENDRNTTAVVEALPDYSHGGKVQVFYDRWDLNTLFKADTIYIGTVDPASPADVICAINAEYGTQLPVDEMTVTKIGDHRARITAKATSHSYLGFIEAVVASVRVPLNERLTASLLKGFLYPNADRPSLNNPIFIKDSIPEAAQAWASAVPQDNRLGYDDIYNGEVHFGMRWASTNGGWNGDRYPIGKRYGQPGDLPRQMTTWRTANGNTGQSTGWFANILLNAPGKTLAEVIAEYDITVTIRSRPSINGAVRTGVYRPVYNVTARRVVLTKLSGDGSATMDGPISNGLPGENYFLTISSGNAMFPGLSENRVLLGGSYSYWYTGYGDIEVKGVRKAGKAKNLLFTSYFQGL